jgi:hypothetical protein
MANPDVEAAVYEVLDQTLDAAVALPRAVNGTVFRDFHVTVNGAMGWDVNRALYRAVAEDTPHLGLGRYLNEVGG